MSVRDELRPLIESAGLREVSRQSGIGASVLSQWLSGAIPSGSQRPRRLSIEQVEALAAVVGMKIVLVKPKKNGKSAP
jgi:hypothetical protein